MRRLRFLLTIPLTAVIVLFAVFNRQDVDLVLWPFSTVVRLPVFLLALGTAGIGLVIGAFLLWIPLLRWRHRANANQRRIAELEEDLKAARALPAAGGQTLLG